MIEIYSILNGEVGFSLTGSQKEYVINDLRKIIPLNKIENVDNNTLSFCTYIKHKDTVIKVAEKYNCGILQLHEKGLPLLIDRYKTRYGLFLGAVVSLLIVIISSKLIWEVRVEGISQIQEREVVYLLDNLGVGTGKIINKSKLESVYNNFLMQESRVARIYINYDGTIAKVQINERNIVPEKLNRNQNINIIAGCDGILKRIDVFDGSPNVSAGETVTKGQLLISAFTETRNSGFIMRAARGNAWAQTFRTIEIMINKHGSEKVYKNSDSDVKMEILGAEIPIELRFKKVKLNTSNTYIKKQLSVKFVSLPIILAKTTRNYYNASTFQMSKPEAKKTAEHELDIIIKSIPGIFDVTGCSCTESETNEHFIFKYILTCIENISQEQIFEFN